MKLSPALFVPVPARHTELARSISPLLSSVLVSIIPPLAVVRTEREFANSRGPEVHAPTLSSTCKFLVRTG